MTENILNFFYIYLYIAIRREDNTVINYLTSVMYYLRLVKASVRLTKAS